MSHLTVQQVADLLLDPQNNTQLLVSSALAPVCRPVLRNLLNDPENEKFHSLRIRNPKVGSALRFKGVSEWLQLAGFRDESEAQESEAGNRNLKWSRGESSTSLKAASQCLDLVDESIEEARQKRLGQHNSNLQDKEHRELIKYRAESKARVRAELASDRSNRPGKRVVDAEQTSSLCTPELRDPMTMVVPLLTNPSQFRVCCKFTVMCYQHAIYLEGRQHVPYLREEDSDYVFPIQAVNLGMPDTTNPDTWRPQEELPKVELRMFQLSRFLESTQMILPPVANGLFQVTVVILEDLPNLRNITASLLAGWPKLRKMHLARLSGTARFFPPHSKAWDVPGSWMHSRPYCPDLEEVLVDSLPKLYAIENNCFCNCPKLENVVFRNLPALTSVGSGWLSNCPSLRDVTFEDLPKLTDVGRNWLLSSTCRHHQLRNLSFQKITTFTKLEVGFLGCTEGAAFMQLLHNDSDAPWNRGRVVVEDHEEVRVRVIGCRHQLHSAVSDGTRSWPNRSLVDEDEIQEERLTQLCQPAVSASGLVDLL